MLDTWRNIVADAAPFQPSVVQTLSSNCLHSENAARKLTMVNIYDMT